MVKMEAFDDSHFMHQAVRVGHTDHTGSIVSLMGCIFDLKKKFLYNRKLIKFVHYWRDIPLVWRKWKRLTILILCTRLLELVKLITLVASFLSWHASLILKRNFYVTGNSLTLKGRFFIVIIIVWTVTFDYCKLLTVVSR